MDKYNNNMATRKNKHSFSMAKFGKVVSTGYRGKDTKKFNPNRKGFWPTHQYIKRDDPVLEANIKQKLAPDGGIDVFKIDYMVDGVIDKEQQLLRDFENGVKMNKIDKTRVDNILTKIKLEIDRDIQYIEKVRFNHIPTTDEGRYMIKMMWLERFLQSDDENKICHMYLKLKDDFNSHKVSLDTLKLPNDYKIRYKLLLERLDRYLVSKKVDMIDKQLSVLSNSLLPLNQTGFVSLEDFQVKVVNLIRNKDNNSSIIVKAPTSAGKTALAGYLFTQKGRFLVTVPTNALAWQLASYITSITKVDVPILTDTFQSKLNLNDLVAHILNTNVVVGTPKELVNILALPEFKDLKFDWMLFDEIHMLGKDEGYEMEVLIKAYPETRVLALSATIGNENELKDWFLKCGKETVEIVEYNKRFINLQRFYYDYNNNNLVRIHPLSMISPNDFENMLDKTINPTPPDVYDLYQKLTNIFTDKEIKHNNYFDKDARLSLSDVEGFFNHLLTFMIKKYKNKRDSSKIKKILDDYKCDKVKQNNYQDLKNNIIKMFFTLKENNKTPAIVFHKNPSFVQKLALDIYNEITTMENTKYPKLFKQREDINKKAKSLLKKLEREKVDEKGEKQILREMKKLDDQEKDLEIVEMIDINEPHLDFILNERQYFTKSMMENWEKLCNPNKDKFFPRDGEKYHYILDLLYRGIGIYSKGLPDPYLRIVQELANKKQLAVVLSDKELVFGVSMPFRTAVILDDENLDSMEYHQMAGRAGRRGKDKEGNVVFMGLSWDRISELSISSIPNIEGNDRALNYGVNIATKLSENERWCKIKDNMLVDYKEDEPESKEFYDAINDNVNEGGIWDYVSKIDNKYLLYLMWVLRETEECLYIPKVLEYLENGFATSRPDEEKDQISVALFLLHFINVEEYKNILLPSHPLLESKFDNLMNLLINEDDGYGFSIPEKIDGKLYYIIRENRCVSDDFNELHNLRERISKFINKLRPIQQYYYYMGNENPDAQKNAKYVNICRLLGKLFTRIKWIYHSSSYLIL
jgi:hypothetical protein